MSSFFGGLKDFTESLGSIYLQREQIKAGGISSHTSSVLQNPPNDMSDYRRVPTGEDSNHSTLVDDRLINGVSNKTLLYAGGFVFLLGAAFLAVKSKS